MGETANSGILYLNGKPIGPVEDVQMTTVGPEGETRFIGMDLSQCHDFTATFTPRFPRISRKQFIRFLQKCGYSKKQAKYRAWKVQKSKCSYSYARFLHLIRGDL